MKYPGYELEALDPRESHENSQIDTVQPFRLYKEEP